MTAKERATEFVKKYPNLFTEDKDFWLTEIGTLLELHGREAFQLGSECESTTEVKMGIRDKYTKETERDANIIVSMCDEETRRYIIWLERKL